MNKKQQGKNWEEFRLKWNKSWFYSTMILAIVIWFSLMYLATVNTTIQTFVIVLGALSISVLLCWFVIYKNMVIEK